MSSEPFGLPPEEDDDAAAFTRSWQPVDLSDVLDGTWEPIMPSVGRRVDGVGLFYAGRCHTVVSETEAGKTWLALAAVLDEMAAGQHVVYLDFEDDEGGIVGRLLTLGADRDRIKALFHYLRPDDPVGTGINLDDLLRMLSEHRPTLAIIDGVTEAMSMHGLNPLDNFETAKFGKMLANKIAGTGAAVVSLDHVTKDRESRGRNAIGAVHKLNALTGASYLLRSRKPFGVGLTGRSTIKIAKDRPGQLRPHGVASKDGLAWFGDLVLISHGEGFAEVSIEAPFEQGEDWRPTELMKRISDALTHHDGPLPQRVILDVVTGGRDSLIAALSYLIADGYVSAKTPHELLKAYP